MKIQSENILRKSDAVREAMAPGLSKRIMGYGSQIMMVELQFEEGAIGAEHEHHHAQSTYIVSGRFEFTVAGGKVEVSAGDGLYFEPNLRHGLRCLEKGTVIDCFSPVREDFL